MFIYLFYLFIYLISRSDFRPAALVPIFGPKKSRLSANPINGPRYGILPPKIIISLILLMNPTINRYYITCNLNVEKIISLGPVKYTPVVGTPNQYLFVSLARMFQNHGFFGVELLIRVGLYLCR
jgi:hypothetical protein